MRLGLPFLVTLAACAPVELGEPVVVAEKTLHVDRVEVRAGEPIATFAAEGDDTLVIEAHQSCELWEKPTAERAIVRRRENRWPGVDLLFAATGAGVAGAGIALVADRSESGTDRAVGTSMLFGGIALGAVALIDYARSRGGEVSTEIVALEGHRIGEGLPCKGGAIDGAWVELRIGTVAYRAGRTDAAGKLRAKISQVIPPDANIPFRAPSATVVVGGNGAGVVDLGALVTKREADAWREVNLQACVDPISIDACRPLAEHQTSYPGGPHVQEAARALKQAGPALAKLQDQATWRRVSPSLAACAKDAAEAEAIEVACGVVSSYVDNVPNGEHHAEAERAVVTGRVRAAELLQSTARKKVLAAKADSDASHRPCIATCRAHCAEAAIKRFDDCFEGCQASTCK